MHLALRLDQIDPRHDGHQIGRRRIDRVHHVDLSRLQRGCARIHVADRQHLDRVEMGAIRLPVIRVLADDGFDTRLVGFEDVAAGADPGVEIHVILGHDEHRGQRQNRGETCIRLVQGDRHLIGGGGLNVLDHGDQRLGLADRVLAPVQVDREDHVIGIHRLAVVEFDTLAQLEHPDGQIVVGFPAGRKLRDENAAGTDLDQVVADLPLQVLHEFRLVHLRVQRLTRVETADSEAERSAGLRRRCAQWLAREAEHCGAAHGARAHQETAPVHRNCHWKVLLSCAAPADRQWNDRQLSERRAACYYVYCY